METKKTKIVDRMITTFIILGSWYILTLFFPPLVVPPINAVIVSLVNILTTSKLSTMIFITIQRLIIGLCLGVFFGLFLGVLMGYFRRFKNIVSPIIGILQAVPPVAWVVLALVWFGFNGRPAIFIVTTATLPVISISVNEGIENIDPRLLSMAKLYKFSFRKKFLHVIFPSILPYFKSSFRIALGSGWKIAVMGEVLTTTDGIGGMIKQSRLNVEPEAIIAWSIIIVSLFYLTDFIISKLTKERHV